MISIEMQHEGDYCALLGLLEGLAGTSGRVILAVGGINCLRPRWPVFCKNLSRGSAVTLKGAVHLAAQEGAWCVLVAGVALGWRLGAILCHVHQ